MTLFYIIKNCKLLYQICKKITRNWQQKRKPQPKRKAQAALVRNQNLLLKQKKQHLVDMQLTLRVAKKQLNKYLVKNQ